MQIRGLALSLILGLSLTGLSACREETPDAASVAAQAAEARAEMEAATEAGAQG